MVSTSFSFFFHLITLKQNKFRFYALIFILNLLKTQSNSIDYELSDTHEVLEYFSDDGSEPGDVVYDYVEDLEPGDDINEIISFNHSAFNNQSLDSILGNIPYERTADTPESYISGLAFNF